MVLPRLLSVDLIVVDEITPLPIGPPWVTIVSRTLGAVFGVIRVSCCRSFVAGAKAELDDLLASWGSQSPYRRAALQDFAERRAVSAGTPLAVDPKNASRSHGRSPKVPFWDGNHLFNE
jgi:hypothetical protein